MTDHNQQETLRSKINRETALITWRELQRHFASGTTVAVSVDLDLVEVAVQMSEDNKAQFAEWLNAGKIGKVSDEQAAAWYEADVEMWSAVVSPWVLVQHVKK